MSIYLDINTRALHNKMELATQLKQSGIPLLLINQEIFGKRSYKPQSDILLSDIRSYADTFRITKQIYKGRFGDTHIEGGHDNWVDWWSNDVYAWGNQHQAIMNGYVEKMYSIWEKFTPLWNHCMLAPQYHLFNQLPRGRRPLSHYKIECFLSSYLDKKTSIRQIRTFWGAMTPEDRRDFIRNRALWFDGAPTGAEEQQDT